MSRCMSDMAGEFKDQKQRVAVCMNQWRGAKSLAYSHCVEISKVDEEQRIVFGWFSVVEKDGERVIDKQGDIITEPELEKAAYDFVLHARTGGVMHKKRAGILVESIVFTKSKQEAMGIDLGFVGWWGGFKILDDETWKGVKSGSFKGFSIAGKGQSREAA